MAARLARPSTPCLAAEAIALTTGDENSLSILKRAVKAVLFPSDTANLTRAVKAAVRIWGLALLDSAIRARALAANALPPLANSAK
ncbi:MAG: hypothetical protein WC522_09505, partial [Candidatus Omnitrophota bacterium]